MNKNRIISLFNKNYVLNNRPPIWFLRQAGRHIPEYHTIRSQTNNFIEFCLNEELIVKSTLLPLKYYDIDAAIVFSDILMIPWAMGRNVSFVKGLGPTMTPMIPNETAVLKNINISKLLKPLSSALVILKETLPKEICLIGFAGAPWTLSCYMIEGQTSKDFLLTRKAAWGSEVWFRDLINTLTIYVADILEMQAKAGADVLMIFDSWSHMIPNYFFDDFAIQPTKNIVDILRSRKIFNPIIGFPFKSGTSLIDYSYKSNVDCVALDWTVNLDWAVNNLNSNIVLQGNLDPASLINNSKNLLYSVNSILKVMENKRFIFNVGHGLTPDCSIENVKKVISFVKNYPIDAN